MRRLARADSVTARAAQPSFTVSLRSWLSPAALWRGLFDPTQSTARYLGRALVLDLPLTLALAALVQLLALGDVQPPPSPPLLQVFALCVAAPVLETAVMMLIFALLRLISTQPAFLVLGSATLWAALHATQAPVWGLTVFWPFCIFSICYLTWAPVSRWRAFWTTTALHALHNAVPALAIVAEQLWRLPK